MKSQPHMDELPKICSTHAERPPPREHLSGSEGLPSYVKRILKDLNYNKLLLTAVKRNLLKEQISK